MMDSQTTARLIREATHITRGRLQNTRLVFKRPQIYAVNLVDHLGNVIETSHTYYDHDLEVEVLCDGDIYSAMSDSSMTMAEWFSELKDITASRLFDLSMTQSVVNVEWSVVGDKANISICFNDSMDGQTNIDAEVIDAILNIIDLKKAYWRELLSRMDSTRELL